MHSDASGEGRHMPCAGEARALGCLNAQGFGDGRAGAPLHKDGVG
jgi:hypothetical protein